MNQEIRFYLFPFALGVVYCVFSSLQMGRVVPSQIKKCHAEPLHNHNTMNDRLLACVALRY